MAGLKNIEDLWMNDCKIANWKEIDILRDVPTLRTVYLERNPIYTDTMYRKKIMITLPQATQIDAIPVRGAFPTLKS